MPAPAYEYVIEFGDCEITYTLDEVESLDIDGVPGLSALRVKTHDSDVSATFLDWRRFYIREVTP